jgi:hypothetical protein
LVKISAEVWSSKILLLSSMIVSSLFFIYPLALATAAFISENVVEAEVAEDALDSSKETCERANSRFAKPSFSLIFFSFIFWG